MTHKSSNSKTIFHAFGSGHLPTSASAFDDTSSSRSVAGTVLPAPSAADPAAAARVMAHYADDVHPAPHHPQHPRQHKRDIAQRTDNGGDAKHRWPVVDTGLGDGIDKMAVKSPTLQHNLDALHQGGWGFGYGQKGAGSSTNRGRATITLDAGKRHNPFAVLRSLAHESGHAMYRPPAPVLMDGHVNRQQYIERNTERCLQDEGEATIANLQVREELLKAKLGDIGVSGAKAKEYKRLFSKYHDSKDHDILRAEIGKVYAQGEHPSTNPALTYEQFCANPFADAWDRSHPSAPKR